MAQPFPEPALALPSDNPGGPALGNAELVARVRGGDQLAFELIMRRHNRRLFRLARIVTNEALGRMRAASRVVSLEAHRRRDGDDEDLTADELDPERLAASGERRRPLTAAVDALPQEFRSVFVLREVEGLSTAETAACLAIRPETVKTGLHRARLQLQETLGQHLLACSPTLFAFDGGRCDRVVGQVLARLGQPTAAPDPSRSAAASGPARPLPRRLGRLSALLGVRRKP